MNFKASILLKWLAKAPPGPVVEIGCMRYPRETESEGFSTFYLAKQCAAEGRSFTSCDVSQKSVMNARQIMSDHGLLGDVRLIDGVTGVKSVQNIAFLYLDSSDVATDTWEQFKAANLAPGAIVVIDDCHPYTPGRYGKGTKVIEMIGEDNVTFESYQGYKMAIIEHDFGG